MNYNMDNLPSDDGAESCSSLVRFTAASFFPTTLAVITVPWSNVVFSGISTNLDLK